METSAKVVSDTRRVERASSSQVLVVAAKGFVPGNADTGHDHLMLTR